MPIAAAGDRALLATFDDISPAMLRARAAAIRRDASVVACVAGHSSLLIVFRDTPNANVLSVDVEESIDPPRVHHINVTFDGPDLHDLPMPLDEVLTRVDRLELTVRYLGFRAGFAYLDGWPSELALPRRATSRTRVPRGSLAIAGEMAGFYPVDSPGGWNLLGRTDAELWNPEREPPNLFAPGDTIVIHANR